MSASMLTLVVRMSNNTPHKNMTDTTGKKFNRLTIVKELGRSRVEAMCDCGNIKTYYKGAIVIGHTKSCGCYAIEKISMLNKTHGNYTHTLYYVWQGIKRRCSNSRTKDYARYGGRGITICDEWKNSFQAFYDWAILNGWGKGLQVDRINNDGNYEPSNCRFVTNAENCAVGRKGVYRNNTSGVIGVSKLGSKYIASITIQGIRRRKAFTTFIEAIRQRNTWEDELNKDITHEQ